MADESGAVPAAATEAPEAGIAVDDANGGSDGAGNNRLPFAFKHCTDVSRKGFSVWTATCNICGKGHARGYIMPPFCSLAY